jgi:hypothetical protein
MGLRSRTIRRIIARASVFLLLGAVVNIAVAWGCVKWSPDPLDSASGVGPWPVAAPGDWPAESHWLRQASCGLTESIAFAAENATPTSPSQRWNQWAFQAGLPFRAVCCRRHTIGLSQIGSSMCEERTANIGEGIVVDVDTGSHQRKRWIPMLPIWPGFLINTLLYAVVWWLLSAAPFALRRRRRIKRGLCPACAYPIGDSAVCTECGSQLPSPSR